MTGINRARRSPAHDLDTLDTPIRSKLPDALNKHPCLNKPTTPLKPCMSAVIRLSEITFTSLGTCAKNTP